MNERAETTTERAVNEADAEMFVCYESHLIGCDVECFDPPETCRSMRLAAMNQVRTVLARSGPTGASFAVCRLKCGHDFIHYDDQTWPCPDTFHICRLCAAGIVPWSKRRPTGKKWVQVEAITDGTRSEEATK